MRVLHLTRDFPPSFNGGISGATGELVSQLQANGIESFVVSFDAWKPKAASDQTPPSKPPEHAPQQAWILRINTGHQLSQIQKFATESRPELLHVHDALLFNEAKALAGRLGAKIVYTVHVYHKAMNRIRGIENTASSRAEQQALGEASLVSVPNISMKSLLRDDFPGSEEKLRIASWGVERASRNKKVRVKEVIYAGRFSDIKGTESLLSLIPGVLTQAQDARFVVAGGIPFNTSAEKKWIASIGTSIGQQYRSRLEMPGWLDRQALCQRLSSAWVMINPSRFETFGLSTMEAMSHSLPVVASKTPGSELLLSHGIDGYLASVDDTDSMIEHLLITLRSKRLRDELGKNALEQVKKKWLWGDRIHDWLRIYKELLTSY